MLAGKVANGIKGPEMLQPLEMHAASQASQDDATVISVRTCHK